jgi:hypothetical protein
MSMACENSRPIFDLLSTDKDEGRTDPHLEAHFVEGAALDLRQLILLQRVAARPGVQVEADAGLTPPRAPAALLLVRLRYPGRLWASCHHSAGLL